LSNWQLIVVHTKAKANSGGGGGHLIKQIEEAAAADI